SPTSNIIKSVKRSMAGEYSRELSTKVFQGACRLIQLGCNSAIDAGIYTFTFGDGRKVQARFTYTYGWDGKQWLITSHHSSAMPEPVKQ
ncbi:MAG: hypothetical protein EB048_11155, partial [Gammaproteobacteria bacterium]|nr:hypothetical protein [Gammaproteobacteria bacterium]